MAATSGNSVMPCFHVIKNYPANVVDTINGRFTTYPYKFLYINKQKGFADLTSNERCLF